MQASKQFFSGLNVTDISRIQHRLLEVVHSGQPGSDDPSTVIARVTENVKSSGYCDTADSLLKQLALYPEEALALVVYNLEREKLSPEEKRRRRARKATTTGSSRSRVCAVHENQAVAVLRCVDDHGERWPRMAPAIAARGEQRSGGVAHPDNTWLRSRAGGTAGRIDPAVTEFDQVKEEQTEMLNDSNIEFTSGEITSYYEARVPELNQRGTQFRGPCPIHHGTGGNFAVEPDTGLWSSHSKCGRGGDIIALEMALTGADFKTAKAKVFQLIGRVESERWRNVDTYRYVDEEGNVLFEVVRRERGSGTSREKDFRQRRPDGRGGWIWNLQGVKRVPYRLPNVLKAGDVYLVEGEKDVHALEGWGLVASCNPGGSGSSRLYTGRLKEFQGRHLVIVPDNDLPGYKHAAAVASILLDVAGSVRVVELTGLAEGGDVTEWRDAGGTAKGFATLVEKAPVLDAAGVAALRTRWGLTEAKGDAPVPQPCDTSERTALPTICVRDRPLQDITGEVIQERKNRCVDGIRKAASNCENREAFGYGSECGGKVNTAGPGRSGRNRRGRRRTRGPC